MARTLERKTWADRKGLPVVVWGERYQGILIDERNRATVFEYREDGIEQLMDYCLNQYRSKGINAIVAGIVNQHGVAYAVFVQDGRLRPVSEDEDFTKKRRKRGKDRAKA